MKKVFVVFLFIFSTVSTFAQSEGESVKPIGGITLYRNVSLAAIEQNNYLDVIVKFKAAELGDYFTNGVKVVVEVTAIDQGSNEARKTIEVVVVDNNTGKKIYRKRFSKSYLYVFSDGTIEVGKGNALTQIILFKYKDGSGWGMILKERGIY